MDVESTQVTVTRRGLRRRRWVLRLASATVMAAMLVVLGSAPPASAAGLKWSAEIVYAVDPGAGKIRQTTTFGITNDEPSTTSGNVTTRYFYGGVILTVPNEAIGITVEGDRGGVSFEVGPLGPLSNPFKELRIEFNRNLFYRQTQSVVVGFDLVRKQPRSTSSFRINEAYASFGVYAYGDPGETVVKVVVEDRFDVDFSGGNFTASSGDGVVTYTDASIEDPTEYFVFVTARDDDRLRVSQIDVGDQTINVKSWPDDTIWTRSVTRSITAGAEILRDLIGLEWDLEDDLDVIEAFDPNLAGYGGWYIQGSDTIEIGEWAGSHLVLHELSHAWFNLDLFGERWITEGLANAYAEEAVHLADLGALSDYERADEPSSSALFRFPLVEWGDLREGTEGDLRRDEYGYAAASWVIGTITDEIGFDRMGEVITSADQNLIAYRGSADPETVTAYDGWERLLDLVEELGGSDTARDLFESYVVPDDVDLGARYEARDSYQALQDAAGDYALPIYIRRPMSDWEFDVAEERILEGHAVLDHVAEVDKRAASMDLETPDLLVDTFSTTTEGFEHIHLELEEANDALNAIEDAEERVAADHPFLTDIGLWGVDLDATVEDMRSEFEQADFDGAHAGITTLNAQLEDAADSGRTRVLIGSGAGTVLLLLATTVTVLLVRRRRRVQDLHEPDAAVVDERVDDATLSGRDDL